MADYSPSFLEDIYQIDSLMSVPYDFLTTGHKNLINAHANKATRGFQKKFTNSNNVDCVIDAQYAI